MLIRKKFVNRNYPYVVINNNELHSTNPSNARKQKTKFFLVLKQGSTIPKMTVKKMWNKMTTKRRIHHHQRKETKDQVWVLKHGSTASWNRVRPERVRRGRLRRVSKILETRGNFDEVSEIKKSTIFFETSRQKILPKWKIWTNPINAKKFAHMLWNRKPYALIDVEKILIGRVQSHPDRVRRGRLLWTPCKCTKELWILKKR